MNDPCTIVPGQFSHREVLWKSARGPGNSRLYSNVALLSTNFLTASMQDKSSSFFLLLAICCFHQCTLQCHQQRGEQVFPEKSKENEIQVGIIV